jgi:hypothetical protein
LTSTADHGAFAVTDICLLIVHTPRDVKVRLCLYAQSLYVQIPTRASTPLVLMKL